MNHVAGPTRELWTPEPYSDPAVRQAIALARAWTAEASPALAWDTTRVVDRHGLDRIPGHRTTPIVAAIVAAAGATMPHFSLPAGADLECVELPRQMAARSRLAHVKRLRDVEMGDRFGRFCEIVGPEPHYRSLLGQREDLWLLLALAAAQLEDDVAARTLARMNLDDIS